MDKKKFLFISYDANISDTAWQVVKEGHDVKFFIDNADEKEVADGLVPKTDNWEKEVEWADIIIFDDTLGFGKHAQRLRKQGKAVIGGTPYTDSLEDDRAFGQEELKSHNVPIIPYESFSSFDDAIAYVKKNPMRYVIKPCGDTEKHLLFVGEEEDGMDVLRILEAYKKTWAKQIKEFQLQRRVMGVEIAVGGFFNGANFIYPICVNFEHKKLFPGEVGPSTGEMGTLMFFSMPNKFFNDTIKKFEETLKKENYRGYFDLNCIVNGNGIYPLEFTARFGYPTLSIQQEGIGLPMGEFLYLLASGENFNMRPKSGFQIGVRLVVPPFPYDDKKTMEAYTKDAAILFKKPMSEGIHIEEIKKVNGDWVITGTAGAAVIVTGTGQTVKQARAQVYHRINNILIPNMYYRTDIGLRWIEDSDRLHNWGYLREA